MTWRELLAEVRERLREASGEAGIEDPDGEARRLVEQASGYEPSELTLSLDEASTQLSVASLQSMVARRCSGEPLQYVLGSWGFRTLDLMVDRRVLIPRPETEVVAGCALAELDRRREVAGDRPLVAVDLGTGSGALALTLAAERERVEVWATDASADALAVAAANLAGLGRPATRVHLAEGSWFEALPEELRGQVDVVVSNPPYIAAEEELPPEVVEWEPASALVAGHRGTEQLEAILEAAPTWLAPGGSVVLEMAPHQVPEMTKAVRAAGFSEVEVVEDLAGHPRAVVARLPT